MKRLAVSDGSLEALKWVGLVVMTGDHINKYLLNGTVTWLFYAGRLAAPLFLFVLGYNLARPGTVQRGAYRRTMRRLALTAAVATPAFVGLGGLWGGWWPGNILLSLLVVTGSIALVVQGTVRSYVLAGTLVVVGGSSVEFWWPGVAFGFGIWWYGRRPGWPAAALATAGLAGVSVVNGNCWAWLALPLTLVVARTNLKMPRAKWLFYAYYPAHLYAILGVKVLMERAGYLFFY